MNRELTARAARRPLRRETAAWQKAAIGMLTLALIGNMVMGWMYLKQKQYTEELEEAYTSSETTREAAVIACGRLAQRCQELEAEIALDPERMRVVKPAEPEEPDGAPAGAQRSGSGGERTSSGMSELSPRGGSEGYGACEDDNSRYAPITEEERELLARLVYLEARGESAEGQQAVAEVALNRVADPGFPDSVSEVLFQRGQFAPAALIPDTVPTDAQYQAVNAALYGEPVLPMDVVYFSQRGENSNVWGTIGGHVFCYQYGWRENG